jgi:hypothetical protein
MKSHRLFGSALVICIHFHIFFLTFGPCHAQQYSPEFQALLNQIQQNYLAPKGENISALRSQYPAVMATLVGHALRQQVVHAQQNPPLNNQFMNLQREAQVYLGDVARTTSARLDDGSLFTPQDLWNIANRAYQGQDDGWILQNFHVQTGTMPSVLAARPGTQTPGPPVLGSPMDREEGNQIELFGMGAPSVKGPPKEPPAPQRQIKPQPDGIVGNWTTYKDKVRLRIWKQGNVYLGSMSGEPSMDYAFKANANDVCFELKHVGEGKTGPKFEGEYIWWTGGLYESINNPPEYRRSKIEFYYQITYDGGEAEYG